jgi:hypothetical protein
VGEYLGVLTVEDFDVVDVRPKQKGQEKVQTRESVH